MKSKIVLLVALLAGAVWARTEIIHTDDPDLGGRLTDAARNRFLARDLIPSIDVANDASWKTVDKLEFFRQEFGRPCEPFVLKVADAKAGATREWTDVKFSRGWGGRFYECYLVELDVEQNVESSDWTFWRNQKRHDFKVCGKGRRTERIRLGWIGNQFGVNRVAFSCWTSNTLAKVHGLRISPVEIPVLFRRRFTLADRPVRGGISVNRYPVYFSVTANGRQLYRSLGQQVTGCERVDLSSALRQGENEVVLSANLMGSFGPCRSVSCELFAVDRAGTLFHSVGDADWQWSADGKTWKPCAVGGVPSCYKVANGRRITHGYVPLHAGALDIRLVGEKYPVFDCDGDIAYEVRIPAGIPDPKVSLVLKNPLTGAEVERVKDISRGGPRPVAAAADTSFVTILAKPATRTVGAYRLFWTLTSGGREIDRDETEMMIAGPVDQKLVPAEDFEKELRANLKPVMSVDCTQEETNPTNFLSHRGLHPFDLITSTVAEERGIRFRQTGVGRDDYISYRIDVGTLGKPHVLEVDYPDTAERILYASVNESFHVGFGGNTPDGRRGWPNVTGGTYSGGLMPLSGEKKTFRMVFFPATRASTVTFSNGLAGHTAAVCGFRIYECDDLPGLKLPKTDRLYGNHHERPLFSPWGAYVDAKITDTNSGYFEDMVAATFEACANRVRFLRYMGHNSAVEGVYMYAGHFVTQSGRSRAIADEFDFNYAMFKMYRHNGIRALAGMEYECSPDLRLKPSHSYSDRQIHEGKVRGAYHVDRHGRQASGFGTPGVNFLHPEIRCGMLDLFGEIYGRYGDIGGIPGLFVVTGCCWGPTFADCGFDDLTIELFQKETGIDLKLPWTGRERFGRRAELLEGRYAEEWKRWKGAKIVEFYREVEKLFATGKNNWRVFAVGGDAVDFGEKPTIDAVVNPHYGCYHLEPSVYESEMFAPAWRQAYRKYGSVFMAPNGLNERNTRAYAASRWWWDTNGVAVYDVRYSDQAAFWDTVEILSDTTPRQIWHTWLDVNQVTAHDAACRRFVESFYATPDVPSVELPRVIGVSAHAFGDVVQLVNASPYPVSGTLEGGWFSKKQVALGAWGVKLVSMKGGAAKICGAFAYDAETMELLRRQAEELAKGPVARQRLTAAVRAEIAALVARSDWYALARRFRKADVIDPMRPYFDGELALREAIRSGAKETVVRDDTVRLVEWTSGEKPRKVDFKEGFAAEGKGVPSGKRLVRTLSVLVRQSGRQGYVNFGLGDGNVVSVVSERDQGYVGLHFSEARGCTWVEQHFGCSRDPVFASNVWHYVAVVADPKGESAIYVDGKCLRKGRLEKVAAQADWKPGAAKVTVRSMTNAEACPEFSFEVVRIALREGKADERVLDREMREWFAKLPEGK